MQDLQVLLSVRILTGRDSSLRRMIANSIAYASAVATELGLRGSRSLMGIAIVGDVIQLDVAAIMTMLAPVCTGPGLANTVSVELVSL